MEFISLLIDSMFSHRNLIQPMGQQMWWMRRLENAQVQWHFCFCSSAFAVRTNQHSQLDDGERCTKHSWVAVANAQLIHMYKPQTGSQENLRCVDELIWDKKSYLVEFNLNHLLMELWAKYTFTDIGHWCFLFICFTALWWKQITDMSRKRWNCFVIRFVRVTESWK